MNKNLIATLLLVISLLTAVKAQDDPYLDKVKSLDTTLETLYAVISGEKGEIRNWELFQYLFKPEATLVPAGKDQDGNVTTFPMTPDEYREKAGKWLEENGFFEKEISRKVDTYGYVTQVFSTYESYKTASDTVPFARGINSIQLMNDGTRWWVINIYWMGETPEYPIPTKYLD